MVEFKSWGKIPRESGEVVTITEKLDGTNACIVIQYGEVVAVQSRNRFITPEDDNYGFASWVFSNSEELLSLGEGYHYGEWAGLGIQKNPYALSEKRFFLFNTARWNANNPNLPNCCSVVPVLYSGKPEGDMIKSTMTKLKESGSQVDVGGDYTGYVEGVVAYYSKTRRYTKTTYEYKNGKWANK